MATIPTTTAVVDGTGLIQGAGVVVNKSAQAVNKNEPIFGVGSSALQGYVALSMYQQFSSSVINGSATLGGGYELFSGDSYASGKPYVMSEATWAEATYSI